MASQHILFAETITAMKKARKRRAYESDSDSEVDYHGNRGHKLKKKARFAHEGHLAPPSGPEVYREIVNHAGYQRAIISRNPPLVDDEGYEIDSDDDEENILDAVSGAAEFNPYANIRLESVLAPLTAVTALPTHATLSRPYTSKTLTELTKQGCNIMHKENAALWKVKHLQTKLIGDHNWVPCELMVGPNDIELYHDDYPERTQSSIKSDGSILMLEHAQTEEKANGQTITNGDTRLPNLHRLHNDSSNADKADTSMVDAGTSLDEAATALNSNSNEERINGQETLRNTKDYLEEDMATKGDVQSLPNGLEGNSEGTLRTPHATASRNTNTAATNGSVIPGDPEITNVQTVTRNHQAANEMANGNSRPVSVMSGSTNDLLIHPIFIPPRSAHPDRDLGIPESEAEDMRRLLQLYVQKQEEVCRGVKRLYEGLLRADRMRKTVLSWSKYEAHVGPNRDMSDGEDWYDKEEWGLEEDLKKGQDEEEDETPQTTKKTRARR
ncbi:RXT2-like protein [Xylariaceae sp. FL1651]|nr:RXT2-like protein [Xylariaceae sp. FL1651]